MTFLLADTFLGSVGEYNREKEMTQKKNGSEWKEEKTEKKGQRLWKKPTITENKRERENEEKDYSFLFSFNMNIGHTKEGDTNSRKQRSACLLSDLVCERKCMK